MPLVDGVYTAAVGHGLPAVLLRALVCACCLMPPTFLMGASLPAAARWIETSAEGVSWMGFFYGGNTVGAVFGCLLAGFYLLRVFDMTTATFVAAAINCVVGLLSLQLAARDLGARRTRPGGGSAGRPGGPRLARIRHHRAVGRGGAGRRSDLDAPARPHARRHCLHVFDHPGGIPDWTRDRQRGRIGLGPYRPGAGGFRRLPVVARPGGGVDRPHAGRIAALLAGESAAFHESLVHFPGRYGARPVGDSAGGAAVGRELSPGAGGGRRARRGSGAPGGKRVRRQYRRRHSGRAGVQPDPDSVDRHAGLRARADRAFGPRRGGGAGAGGGATRGPFWAPRAWRRRWLSRAGWRPASPACRPC